MNPDFSQYYEAREPGRRERAYGWATAIGLQAVDGLVPSTNLIETARRNIEGEITAAEARKIVDAYYETKLGHDAPNDEKEADKVAVRINQIIHLPSFRLSPEYFLGLHGKIFEGVFSHAGTIRQVDLTKKEWVLNGESVHYEASFFIEKSLRIGQEYGTPVSDAVKNLHRHNDVVTKTDDVAINVAINPADVARNRGTPLSSREEMAALAIQRDPRLSAAGLASLFDVSHRQAQRIIAALKAKAGLQRHGARKNGEWRFAPTSS